MSARHCGGSVGQVFAMDGEWYHSVEIVEHPVYDIQLIRVSRALPGWHRFATALTIGEPVLLGGNGVTTTGPLDGDAGWNWSGGQGVHWGANTLGSDSAIVSVTFDRPSSAAAVP